MTEAVKKLSRKTRKMLALLEAPVAAAREQVIEAARALPVANGDDEVDEVIAAILRAVTKLRETEALLAAAEEVARG